MEEGVIASIAATFTSNICAKVKSPEKPNISIDVFVNKVTLIPGSSTNCPVAMILSQWPPLHIPQMANHVFLCVLLRFAYQSVSCPFLAPWIVRDLHIVNVNIGGPLPQAKSFTYRVNFHGYSYFWLIDFMQRIFWTFDTWFLFLCRFCWCILKFYLKFSKCATAPHPQFCSNFTKITSK